MDQLVSAGLNNSHFEASKLNYNTFLTDVNLGIIKNLFQESTNPSPLQKDVSLDIECSESSESSDCEKEHHVNNSD